MRSIREYWQLARLFPGLLLLATVLMIIDAFFSTLSVVTVAPLADLFLQRPQAEWTGVTKGMRELLSSANIEFSVVSVASVIWVSMLAMSVVSVFVRWSALRIRYAVVRHLLVETYENIYRTDWSFFARIKRGELINTFVRELNSVGTAFQSISAAIALVVRIVALLAVPMLFQPVLVGLCIVASLLLLAPFLVMGRWSYQFGKQNVAASNRYTALVRESLDAAKEVVSFGRRDYTIQHVSRAFDNYSHSAVRSGTMSFFSSQMFEPAGFLVLLIVLVYAGSIGLSASAVAVVLWGSLRTIPLFKQLITFKHQMDNLLPSLEQVKGLQSRAISYVRTDGGREFGGLRSEVRLRNLSFSYEEERKALVDVTLDIPRSKIVALVGESGSGKSTIADIIIGLHAPDSGQLLVDDHELREYLMLSWRSRIGLVPQNPVLFDLSVRDNLLWSDPDADDEQIAKACRIAGAEDFISRLPEGLDTEIGDNGIRLSGGQAQRLALARALVRNPDLLILDEATSALDSETEATIYASLCESLKDTAILIIAHRLSTVSVADQIYVMRGGEIIEDGDFASLVRQDGYFKKLLDIQTTT